MAGSFLRRPRTHFGAALGKLLSWSDQPRSRGGLLADTSLRSPKAMGGWRGSGGVPLSSWAGAAGAWRYQSYQRPQLAKWGDWACLGLTALAGGLLWTSRTSTEVPPTERLVHVVIVYGALRYSLKRKVLRLKLKWLRHKLVLRGVILQEFERDNEARLGEADNILRDLEDAMSYKMENIIEKVPIDGDDPFLISASILLQRIEKLKEFLSRKYEGSNDTSLHLDFDSKRTEWFAVHLSRLEVLVRRLVISHATIEVHIVDNKELVAKVDDMLLKLEKER